MPVALPIAARPAQRERRVTGRMVLAALIGFFLVIATANAVMITAALTTFGGTRTDSSYRAGQRFAAEVAAAEAQDARGWTVETAVQSVQTAAPDAAAEPLRRVTIDPVDAAGVPVAGLEAYARLEHPADARRDLALALTTPAPGHYEGTIAAASGQWDLVIELVRDGAPVFRSTRRIFVP